MLKMSPKKYAVKGKPDFHNISDEKLKSFVDLTQQMIFAYNHHDDAKVEVLKAIWKDFNDEYTYRIAKGVYKSVSHVEEVPVLLKKVPKIRKSPAKKL